MQTSSCSSAPVIVSDLADILLLPKPRIQDFKRKKRLDPGNKCLKTQFLKELKEDDEVKRRLEDQKMERKKEAEKKKEYKEKKKKEKEDKKKKDVVEDTNFCGICGKDDQSDENWISCDHCERWFHFDCTEQNNKTDDFKCKYCK